MRIRFTFTGIFQKRITYANVVIDKPFPPAYIFL